MGLPSAKVSVMGGAQAACVLWEVPFVLLRGVHVSLITGDFSSRYFLGRFAPPRLTWAISKANIISHLAPRARGANDLFQKFTLQNQGSLYRDGGMLRTAYHRSPEKI